MTLLKETGIHRQFDDGWTLDTPSDDSFTALWETCDDFLESSKRLKKNVFEFIQLLSKEPLKLKRGFIDFWLPIYLYIKREDFALYGEHGFIPNIIYEIFELMRKAPKNSILRLMM